MGFKSPPPIKVTFQTKQKIYSLSSTFCLCLLFRYASTSVSNLTTVVGGCGPFPSLSKRHLGDFPHVGTVVELKIKRRGLDPLFDRIRWVTHH